MSPKDPRQPELILEIVPLEPPKRVDKDCFVFEVPDSLSDANWKPKRAPLKPS